VGGEEEWRLIFFPRYLGCFQRIDSSGTLFLILSIIRYYTFLDLLGRK